MEKRTVASHQYRHSREHTFPSNCKTILILYFLPDISVKETLTTQNDCNTDTGMRLCREAGGAAQSLAFKVGFEQEQCFVI